MPAIGGSIESLDLDGRNFAVAADSDGQMKSGGFENEVAANGGGTARLLQTRVPFQLEGINVEIDDDAEDLEFLQALANRHDFFPIAVTLAGGAVWQGTGQITGDSSRSTQSATMPINVMGTGDFTQQ